MRSVFIAITALVALSGIADAKETRSHERGAGLRTESTQEVLKRRDDRLHRIHAGRAPRIRHPRAGHDDLRAATPAIARIAPPTIVTTAAEARTTHVVPSTVMASPQSGFTAQCRDGSYSSALSHSGACSGHGGVATFFK